MMTESCCVSGSEQCRLLLLLFSFRNDLYAVHGLFINVPSSVIASWPNSKKRWLTDFALTGKRAELYITALGFVLPVCYAKSRLNVTSLVNNLILCHIIIIRKYSVIFRFVDDALSYHSYHLEPFKGQPPHPSAYQT